MPEDDIADEIAPEDEEMEVIEVNGQQHRSWELPANSAPAIVGQKLQLLLMTNPQQVFRIFRADDTVFITAIEGEEWSKV